MKIKVLASGSKANCYLLETDKGSLMLDCGMTFRKLKESMDFDLSKVVGCLVSHSHFDHAKSVKELMNAGVDVYATKGTFQELNITELHRVNYIQSKHLINLKQKSDNIGIMPFETHHDTSEPVGFFVREFETDKTVVFATDTYYLSNTFMGANVIMIECNFITEKLLKNAEQGLIHPKLKDRLLESHFSLENVKEFLKATDLSKCKKIILLHLSETNADADRMVEEIEDLTGIETLVAEAGLEVEI